MRFWFQGCHLQDCYPVLDEGSDDGRKVPSTDSRFHSQEGRAVIGAERKSEVEDARRVQIWNPVAVRIDSNLDDADELHQIGDRLSHAVGNKQNRPWWGTGPVCFISAEDGTSSSVSTTCVVRSCAIVLPVILKVRSGNSPT